MFRNISKFVVIAFVAIGVLFPFGVTNKAYAFPTFETNPAVVGGVIATGGATVASNAVLQILNGLAWSVAKMTVQSITRSTVNWINGGFNGSPAFVTDLKSNLQNLGDAVADDFFGQLNGAVVGATGFNIVSPFQDQVAAKLRQEYYAQASSHGMNPYTLNQCSQDPSAFINQGRFSQGGFNAWFCANQNPANNPFGAYLQASNALWAQIDIATQNRKSELQWGNGFLSWKGNCTASNTASGLAVNTTVNEDALSASLGLPSSAATTKPADLSPAEKCAGGKIQTPGAVINSQLEKSLGSGIDQLNLADSINEIVGALMSQLVNQVLGATGLSGVSQPSAGGGSYISQASDPSQYNAQTVSLADGFVDSLTDEQTNTNEYGAQWQIILDAANAAQQKCGAQSDITAVITKANTEIARASSASNLITSLINQVQAAKASLNSASIASIISQNSSMLTTAPVSASDLAYATTQSTDTGTDTPSSLLTQMTNKQKSCGVAP